MIRYFEKAKGKESYCECPVTNATHFSKDGGDMQPISQLKQVENISTPSDEEALDMPVMNFDEGEEEQQTQNEDVLDIPTL